MVVLDKEEKVVIPKELIDDLRVNKIPCPKCHGSVTVFAEAEPKVEVRNGQPMVQDFMRCLSCAAMYYQEYY